MKGAGVLPRRPVLPTPGVGRREQRQRRGGSRGGGSTAGPSSPSLSCPLVAVAAALGRVGGSSGAEEEQRGRPFLWGTAQEQQRERPAGGGAGAAAHGRGRPALDDSGPAPSPHPCCRVWVFCSGLIKLASRRLELAYGAMPAANVCVVVVRSSAAIGWVCEAGWLGRPATGIKLRPACFGWRWRCTRSITSIDPLALICIITCVRVRKRSRIISSSRRNGRQRCLSDARTKFEAAHTHSNPTCIETHIHIPPTPPNPIPPNPTGWHRRRAHRPSHGGDGGDKQRICSCSCCWGWCWC